jgi:hypothetical protein
VPKKRYLTVLDMVMNVGLLVQLVSCALVYFHSDLPYAPEGAVRHNALYAVTDASVAAIEAVFVRWVIGGWIGANLALVACACAFELYDTHVRHFSDRTVTSVDRVMLRILPSALDNVMQRILKIINNEYVGTLTTHRMSSERVSNVHEIENNTTRTTAV